MFVYPKKSERLEKKKGKGTKKGKKTSLPPSFLNTKNARIQCIEIKLY